MKNTAVYVAVFFGLIWKISAYKKTRFYKKYRSYK